MSRFKNRYPIPGLNRTLPGVVTTAYLGFAASPPLSCLQLGRECLHALPWEPWITCSALTSWLIFPASRSLPVILEFLSSASQAGRWCSPCAAPSVDARRLQQCRPSIGLLPLKEPVSWRLSSWQAVASFDILRFFCSSDRIILRSTDRPFYQQH